MKDKKSNFNSDNEKETNQIFNMKSIEVHDSKRKKISNTNIESNSQSEKDRANFTTFARMFDQNTNDLNHNNDLSRIMEHELDIFTDESDVQEGDNSQKNHQIKNNIKDAINNLSTESKYIENNELENIKCDTDKIEKNEDLKMLSQLSVQSDLLRHSNGINYDLDQTKQHDRTFIIENQLQSELEDEKQHNNNNDVNSGLKDGINIGQTQNENAKNLVQNEESTNHELPVNLNNMRTCKKSKIQENIEFDRKIQLVPLEYKIIDFEDQDRVERKHMLEEYLIDLINNKITKKELKEKLKANNFKVQDFNNNIRQMLRKRIQLTVEQKRKTKTTKLSNYIDNKLINHVLANNKSNKTMKEDEPKIITHNHFYGKISTKEYLNSILRKYAGDLEVSRDVIERLEKGLLLHLRKEMEKYNETG